MRERAEDALNDDAIMVPIVELTAMAKDVLALLRERSVACEWAAESCGMVAALTEDAREMAWLLRRCHQEARFHDAEELKGLLTAWTVAHRNEYEPTGQTEGETP